jgi:hypothetical protein
MAGGATPGPRSGQLVNVPAGLITAAAVTLASIAGCADGRHHPPAQPADRTKPRSLFVVVGGRESAGQDRLPDRLHTSWSQIAFANDFPVGTVYVNVARPDTTVADALTQQLPLAVEQRPTVVAVWLGEGDDDVGTPPVQFGSDLRSLLGKLRRHGATRVLVASPPARARGARYTSQIADAARSTGAELVPLSPAAWDTRAPDYRKVGVQAAAANEFGRALKR